MATTNFVPIPAEICSGSGRILIVGSGPEDVKEVWASYGLEAVRLDIEPRHHPDIVGSMTDLGDIGEFRIILACHSLEHLYPHEVFLALNEFYRVLVPGGHVVIHVPDLEDVKPTDEPLQARTELGPITGLHLFYGDPAEIPQFPYMAHHSGFIADTLRRAVAQVGFVNVKTRRAPLYNLTAIGEKP